VEQRVAEVGEEVVPHADIRDDESAPLVPDGVQQLDTGQVRSVTRGLLPLAYDRESDVHKALRLLSRLLLNTLLQLQSVEERLGQAGLLVNTLRDQLQHCDLDLLGLRGRVQRLQVHLTHRVGFHAYACHQRLVSVLQHQSAHHFFSTYMYTVIAI
jgi:hypothetical protein